MSTTDLDRTSKKIGWGWVGLAPIVQTLCEREILSQAMELLEASGKLWRNYQEQYPDAYAEAWLKTLEYFYRHYREYDPTKAQVATWLNFDFIQSNYDFI